MSSAKEKLAKLEALAERGATEGERNAARSAIERITGKPYHSGEIDFDIESMTIDDIARIQQFMTNIDFDAINQGMRKLANAIQDIANAINGGCAKEEDRADR